MRIYNLQFILTQERKLDKITLIIPDTFLRFRIIDLVIWSLYGIIRLNYWTPEGDVMLKSGLYEQIINQGITEELKSTDKIIRLKNIDEGESSKD